MNSNSSDKTLYQSPYMIVTDYDYTKHYYIEGQRISSKIGGGFGNADIDPLNENNRVPIEGHFSSYEEFQIGLEEMLQRSFECAGHEVEYIDYSPGLNCMEELAQMDEPEEQLYFYHPDHLGSSAFITDAGGNAHQHMQYLPFGETFIDQRIDWKPRFTFTDKEKDRNTGYHYHGARYYDPEISVWISVDQMSDKFPTTSPYMYTAGNPILLIDPSGMEPTPKEAIAMIKHVNSYFDKSVKLIGNWEFVNSYDSRNKNGFTAGLYRREKENGEFEYAFVTRGSDISMDEDMKDNTLKDWKNNVQQMSGSSEQYKYSIEKAKEVRAQVQGELTFVGQSLGGGLASANALETGDRAITFNAAGLSNQTIDNLGLSRHNNVTAYIIRGEIVDYLQRWTPGVNRAYGNRVVLPANYLPPINNVFRIINIRNRIKNHFIEAFDQYENNDFDQD